MAVLLFITELSAAAPVSARTHHRERAADRLPHQGEQAAGLGPAATPMDLGGCWEDEEDQQPKPQPNGGGFPASEPRADRPAAGTASRPVPFSALGRYLARASSSPQRRMLHASSGRCAADGRRSRVPAPPPLPAPLPTRSRQSPKWRPG